MGETTVVTGLFLGLQMPRAVFHAARTTAMGSTGLIFQGEEARQVVSIP